MLADTEELPETEENQVDDILEIIESAKKRSKLSESNNMLETVTAKHIGKLYNV